ncbi:hypothetical protein [Providencia burhodogranariea]|uniref:Uncharacterized protein n=1 Tax=Providencia burhodogranariea DSM 19968 TaxID=1141662 RepID=K8WPB9_9GAMM|nr:hypothetical protein [Providencia burhodogranariea]EKT62458.1 hypothetical protein OOA_07720 [Providencia burhodogranariea DSM 19968]
MTNIQLLLLTINNFSQSDSISHSQISYIYQFYHLNIAPRNLKVSDFLKEFIKQVEPVLKNNIGLYIQRAGIYNLIEHYLQQAEDHFINRQAILNKM